MKERGRKALVVVPTYYEAENVDELLEGIFSKAPWVEVLFVDDGSRDGTVERIVAAQGRHPGRIHLLRRPAKLGLGTAYVAGFRWALERGYEAMVEMDADLSHDPRHLPTLLALLDDHDVAIGSRYVPGGGTANWNALRRFISRFGSLYAKLALGMGVHDLTGGFNAWRREVLETIDPGVVRSEGYAFQIELKYRAARAGFRLVETPILFVDRQAGRSKMSWRVVLEGMLRVWTLRLGSL